MSVSICSLRTGIADNAHINSGDPGWTTAWTHTGSRSWLVQTAPVTFQRRLSCSSRVLQRCAAAKAAIHLYRGLVVRGILVRA